MKTKDVAKIETIYISFFFGSCFSTQSIISISVLQLFSPILLCFSVAPEEG